MISRGIGKSAARSVARSLSQFGSGGVAPPSYDTDAQTYITAVESADGQSLETGVKDAINAFVVGCKSDGIWTAIKASCILAGAKTLTGALVPLVGTSPTNNNFVSGDYSRETGLVGNGSTKYLNSNRNNNADPQNSQHLAVYVTSQRITGSRIYLSSDYAATGASGLSDVDIRSRNTTATNISANALGLIGKSRSSSSNVVVRVSSISSTYSITSSSPSSSSIHVFSSSNNSLPFRIDARLSFYSIGEAIDLALLDSRVSTLMTAIGAAIP